MRVFLAGISNVGKTAIGTCLARRLGCAFYDLDCEIEKHFGKRIEALNVEEPWPRGFRKRFASVVLAKLIHAEQSPCFVMALRPSGLMDSMWSVLKRVDRIVVVLRDSPENILARIRFYDSESKPVVKLLTERDRRHYLREIKKDAAYFGRTFRKADLAVDIHELDVEKSAEKIERLLRERMVDAE